MNHRNIVGKQELILFRADSGREQTLGITEYVVCRECGECTTVIKHLRRHGLTKDEYRAKWSGAPTVSEAERKLRKDAGERRWADPARREQQAAAMISVWENISNAKRKKWLQHSTAALNTPEVSRRISEGTKKGLADPAVRAKIGQAASRAWAGNTARREKARAIATTIFTDPDVIARQKAGHSKPETREKISQAGKRTWEHNEERRKQVGEWAKKLWDKRRRALDAFSKAKRPATKAAIFAEAHKLREAGRSWSIIARKLQANDYRQDPEGTLNRLKQGVRYYRKQK